MEETEGGAEREVADERKKQSCGERLQRLLVLGLSELPSCAYTLASLCPLLPLCVYLRLAFSSSLLEASVFPVTFPLVKYVCACLCVCVFGLP